MITTRNCTFIWLKWLTLAVVFFAVGLNAAPVWSWSNDTTVNTAISTGIGTDHFEPQITTDGFGGAIITWFDSRNGSYDIYAQRVNEAGAVQWTANGVAICSAANIQWHPQIVSDWSGGAIITWVDYRNGSTSDIYAQKIDANGVVQWTEDGVALTSGLFTNGLQIAEIIPATGGAIITWADSRNGNSDIYAQKVNSSGVPQWTANGVAISAAANSQDSPQIIFDWSGGAIIAWYDYRDGNNDIYAQKVNATGAVQWTANGVAIITDIYTPRVPLLVTDSYGGVIFAWDDWISDWNIYMQKVDGATGAIMWGVDGVAITSGLEDQEYPAIVIDGVGGAYVTWQDSRNYISSNWDIYAQKINTTGTPSWTANGIVISTASNYQQKPQIVAGGSGAIITWDDGRSGNNDIYTQKVDPTGALQWTTNGVAITTAANNQGGSRNIRENGGVISTWIDERGANKDIYAQRVYANGDLIPTFTVGGTVSGLAVGNSVELEINDSDDDDPIVRGNGAFVFDTTLIDGSTYLVTVLTQPDSPSQTCSVSNGSGTISGENVTDIQVSCKGFPWVMFVPATQDIKQ